MITGNTLFSSGGGIFRFGIFSIGYEGFSDGITGALKRDAMLLLSFAWLSSSYKPDDLYETFVNFKRTEWRKVMQISLRGIFTLGSDIRLFYLALRARGLAHQRRRMGVWLYHGYLVMN